MKKETLFYLSDNLTMDISYDMSQSYRAKCLMLLLCAAGIETNYSNLCKNSFVFAKPYRISKDSETGKLYMDYIYISELLNIEIFNNPDVYIGYIESEIENNFDAVMNRLNNKVDLELYHFDDIKFCLMIKNCDLEKIIELHKFIESNPGMDEMLTAFKSSCLIDKYYNLL